MTEQILSTISLNLSEGSFTISGSESFVNSNREAILEFIERNITFEKKQPQHTPIAIKSNQEENSSLPILNQEEKDYSSDKYVKAGVYHVDTNDGTVSILKKVPGKNNAEKTKNIALIVLYIKQTRITGSSIKPLCEKHNCLDSSNFASTFNNEKTNFIKKGAGTSWTIELTHPGEQAAVDLLEDLAANAAK